MLSSIGVWFTINLIMTYDDDKEAMFLDSAHHLKLTVEMFLSVDSAHFQSISLSSMTTCVRMCTNDPGFILYCQLVGTDLQAALIHYV